MLLISANAADAKRDRCAARTNSAHNTPKGNVMTAPHVLAVAVFEVQIKLVPAEKLEKMFAIGTVIAVCRAVVLLKFGGKVLVVHAVAQNVNLEPGIKQLLHLLGN